MPIYKRIPTQIVVAAFTSEHAAEDALKVFTATYAEAVVEAADAIMEDANESSESNNDDGEDAPNKADLESLLMEIPLCSNAVIASKNSNGKTHVKELGKPQYVDNIVSAGLLGGAGGAVLGGIAGLLLGPVGVGLGAMNGMAAGAVASSTMGAAYTAVSRNAVETIAPTTKQSIKDALLPESSVLVLIFDEVVVDYDNYKKEMKEVQDFSNDIIAAMAVDINENLQAGRDCANLFAISEEGVVGMKSVADQTLGTAELAGLVLTGEGIATGAVSIDASTGSAEAVGFLATEDAAVAAGGAAAVVESEEDIGVAAAGATVVATEDAIFGKGTILALDNAYEYVIDAPAQTTQ